VSIAKFRFKQIVTIRSYTASWLVLPDLFRGMGAWRNSTKTQQTGHTPWPRPNVKMEGAVPKMARRRGSNAELDLLVYLQSYHDQETAKGPLRPSSKDAIGYCQSNHSKVEAIPYSAFPKDTTSELTGLSSHYPF